MAYTIPGFLKTLTEWLVSVSRWFDGWDITILVPALIILTVIAGVTGRAAVGPRLWMQLVWGTVVYGQINVYGVTTKSERHKRSYWTRTADGNGIGGRKAPVPYGS